MRSSAISSAACDASPSPLLIQQPLPFAPSRAYSPDRGRERIPPTTRSRKSPLLLGAASASLCARCGPQPDGPPLRNLAALSKVRHNPLALRRKSPRGTGASGRAKSQRSTAPRATVYFDQLPSSHSERNRKESKVFRKCGCDSYAASADAAPGRVRSNWVTAAASHHQERRSSVTGRGPPISGDR
jgi:hypothetical protein